MAQNTTALATGIRAFNALTTSGTGEDTAITVLNGDGGQLALEEVDGTVGAGGTVTFRVYAIGIDGSSEQVGQFEVPASSNFSFSFKGGAYGRVDEFLNQKISVKGAQNLGLVGVGGIRITAQAGAAVSVAIGATFDRRVDGPI